MIRNIPSKYKQEDLIKEILEEGQYKFDFYYLPLDLKSKCNRGYAFINLIHPIYALKLFEDFNERAWKGFQSTKICEVQFSRIQSKAEFEKHFCSKAIAKKKKLVKVAPVLLETPELDTEEIELIRQEMSN